jgi:Lipopolysaccharide-assembly
MRVWLLSALCLLTACARLHAQEGAVQRLQDVHRIYVDSFGTGDGADVIRSKVITRLVKAGRFEIVQSADQADAVLTGASQVSKTAHYSANTNGQYGNASGGTRYHATAGVQLVSKDQKILWADDTSNGAFSRSASSSLADRIVKNLLKAISKEAKPK